MHRVANAMSALAIRLRANIASPLSRWPMAPVLTPWRLLSQPAESRQQTSEARESGAAWLASTVATFSRMPNAQTAERRRYEGVPSFETTYHGQTGFYVREIDREGPSCEWSSTKEMRHHIRGMTVSATTGNEQRDQTQRRTTAPRFDRPIHSVGDTRAGTGENHPEGKRSPNRGLVLVQVVFQIAAILTAGPIRRQLSQDLSPRREACRRSGEGFGCDGQCRRPKPARSSVVMTCQGFIASCARQSSVVHVARAAVVSQAARAQQRCQRRHVDGRPAAWRGPFRAWLTSESSCRRREAAVALVAGVEVQDDGDGPLVGIGAEHGVSEERGERRGAGGVHRTNSKGECKCTGHAARARASARVPTVPFKVLKQMVHHSPHRHWHRAVPSGLG